jgi:hypothetical protein
VVCLPVPRALACGVFFLLIFPCLINGFHFFFL